MRRTVASLIVALAGIALAATLSDAKNQYARGDFLAAATTAAGLNTADALAFAAKATSIHASTRPEKEQEALFARAESYARKAIDLNPNDPDGYFELARALGRLSQLRGVLTALFQGLGTQVKDNLDKTLKLDPNYASAMVGLAVWHAEIAAKGVAWMYGADPNKVVPLMEKAIALEPEMIAHRVEYARALMLLDQKNRDKARAILEKAVTLTPRDAAERLDLEHARRDLAALN